jgi:hypothetical protein
MSLKKPDPIKEPGEVVRCGNLLLLFLAFGLRHGPNMLGQQLPNRRVRVANVHLGGQFLILEFLRITN